MIKSSKLAVVMPGMMVCQPAHPEFGIWRIVQGCPGVSGSWVVRGSSGSIVVDGAELHAFWEVVVDAQKPCGCHVASGCSCASGFDNGCE